MTKYAIVMCEMAKVPIPYRMMDEGPFEVLTVARAVADGLNARLSPVTHIQAVVFELVIA